MLKIIENIQELYKKDFDAWKNCYKRLIDAVFEADENKEIYKKKDKLAWLDDKFVEKYIMRAFKIPCQPQLVI